MEMKCLIVLLQISWVFAQGAPGGADDFGGFSLYQTDLVPDGAGASNETANDTSSDQQLLFPPGGGDQQLLYQPGADQAVLADQPQQGPPVVPTRVPNSGGPSTPPPLVRPEGNSTANATTAAPPPPTESPKSKGDGGGSAEFIGNFALVLGGACVLHLLY